MTYLYDIIVLGDGGSMPRNSPFEVKLSADERLWLESVSKKYTSSYINVIRAKIILYAAEGMQNVEIAKRLDLPRQVVSKWRKRFYRERLRGLEDRPRRGRPPDFPP